MATQLVPAVDANGEPTGYVIRAAGPWAGEIESVDQPCEACPCPNCPPNQTPMAVQLLWDSLPTLCPTGNPYLTRRWSEGPHTDLTLAQFDPAWIHGCCGYGAFEDHLPGSALFGVIESTWEGSPPEYSPVYAQVSFASQPPSGVPANPYGFVVVTFIGIYPYWFGCHARTIADVVDQEQLEGGNQIGAFNQLGLAQSFQTQEARNISGAAVLTRAGVGGGDIITIDLFDALPNAGGRLLAEGTVSGVTPGNWARVRWAPVNIAANRTYYLVFSSNRLTMALAGSTANPYQYGNAYAGVGYQPQPGSDYAFKTYTGAQEWCAGEFACPAIPDMTHCITGLVLAGGTARVISPAGKGATIAALDSDFGRAALAICQTCEYGGEYLGEPRCNLLTDAAGTPCNAKLRDLIARGGPCPHPAGCQWAGLTRST